MSGAYMPKWKRLLVKYVPKLFRKCPGQNFHWAWDNICYCQVNEHHGDWHGGIGRLMWVEQKEK